MSEKVIELTDIVKVYPPSVLALNGVNLTVRAGDIHAIVGENGAGKSTLMKLLYGLESFQSGSIALRGKPVTIRIPREAVALGVGMVHQEFMLIPNYTVWQNVILGAEPRTAWGSIDRRRGRSDVSALIEEYAFALDPDSRISDLSVAAQQKVEILKLLYRDVEILILDEPTAVLTPQEIEELFRRLVRLKEGGKTVLFISHKLDEVLLIADTITVMRRGEVVASFPNKDLTKPDLARAMVGREVVFAVEKTPHERGKEVFALRAVTRMNGSTTLLDEMSLAVHAGEIVGIAGVEGNGQHELVQVVMGEAIADRGTVTLCGGEVTHQGVAQRRGLIGFVSQDRRRIGSSQGCSILDNTTMTHHRHHPRFRSWWTQWLSPRAAKEGAREVIDRFGVIASHEQAAIGTLSGGNQQKVIVGREILLDTPFLLLDQPTRGLDVGSIEAIQRMVLERRTVGCGILLISADLDELLALSDRLLVINRGSIVARLNPTETDKGEVGAYMLGVHE